MSKINSTWANIKAAALTVITLCLVVPVVAAALYLTPVLMIIVLGVALFVLYKVLMHDPDLE